MRIHLLTGAAILMMATPAWAQDNACEAEIAKVQAAVEAKEAQNVDDPDIERARAILLRAAYQGGEGDISGCLQTVEAAKGPAGWVEGSAEPMMVTDEQRAQIDTGYRCEAAIMDVQSDIDELEAQNTDDPNIDNARAILARAASAGAKGDTEVCIDMVNNAKASAN
ncbi:MAG TPA: hypothetical protein VK862_13780 [Afifellaceae bacterium]|nr:hypothetical protein [Afifellaceae bacterium]